MPFGPPKGVRYGGRQKGTPNKRTIAMRAKLAENPGMEPLDYMLQVMRDEKNPRDVRMQAARDAAPYRHPKLASMEHKGSKDPIKIIIQGSDRNLL